MNATKPSSDAGRGRRLFVAVVIATATAAVTAGVALNGRHPQAAAAGADAMPRMTVTPSDRSLPAAAPILPGVPAEAGEQAPTF
jgi:hypothetical protein